MKYLIIGAVLAFAGCVKYEEKKNVKYVGTVEVYSTEVDGHKYIILDGPHKGGIVHSESCPCKKEAQK